MTHLSTAQFLVGFAIAAVAGGAVFLHAEKHRIRHPTAWASAVFLALAIALPAYLIHVSRVRRARGRR